MRREPDVVAAEIAFAAAVQRRDDEAKAYYQGLPKREKTVKRAWMLGEQRNMQRGDRESRIFQTIGKMAADLKAYTEKRSCAYTSPSPSSSAARACCSGGRTG